MILTHVSDVETASVGAMIRGPTQQDLVACGGQAEGCFNVTTEWCHALAVDVGPWTERPTCTSTYVDRMYILEVNFNEIYVQLERPDQVIF